MSPPDDPLRYMMRALAPNLDINSTTITMKCSRCGTRFDVEVGQPGAMLGKALLMVTVGCEAVPETDEGCPRDGCVP